METSEAWPSAIQPHRAWRRFRRNHLAIAGALVLAFFLLGGLLTLPFSMRWYNLQELDTAVRHPPTLHPVVPFTSAHTRSTSPPRPGHSLSVSRRVYAASSWLGHDDLGRSLLFRILPGFLVSFAIGLAAALLAVILGTTWGAIAAMMGGRIDAIMMRVVDVLYGLPYILMVILLKVGLTRPLTVLWGGHGAYVDLAVLLLAIGAVSWLTMARVVRGQVLSLRTRPFVEAARAMGAGPFHILRRHLLPNLIGPVVVYATLVVPQAILQESFLSFLGIGVQQPTPSLGRLAADGVEAVNLFVDSWWLIVFPCGVLVVTLLALNFLGDGLRDALDPQSSASMVV